MNWDQALKDFKYYLKIERGLSENSVEAYGRDIQKFAEFQIDTGSSLGPVKIKEENVREFIYRTGPEISALFGIWHPAPQPVWFGLLSWTVDPQTSVFAGLLRVFFPPRVSFAAAALPCPPHL